MGFVRHSRPLPSHIPAELVRDIDIVNDAGVLADPYLAFDRLRDDADVLWSPHLGGHWIVLGAELVREVFRNPSVFSNYPTGVPPMTEFWPRKLIPQELDGEDHCRYRRLLSPFFKPSAIRPMADSVSRRARELIGVVADRDEFEFMGAVAIPLPSTVFMDLFGLPVDQADLFTGWTQQLLHACDVTASAHAANSIVGYLLDLIALRREAPRDDLISALVSAEVDGRLLSTDELLDMAFLLFIAGLDTVTAQLGVVVNHLARDGDVQRQLRADPAQVPAVLEELLRLYPIVPPARTLTQNYDLGEVTMRTGDTVLLATSAASRDPLAYHNARQLQMGRTSAWTTAFGMGPHRCLGAHLARQELTIVLQLMIEMLPEYEAVPGFEPKWHTAGNVWGIDTLRLRLNR